MLSEFQIAGEVGPTVAGAMKKYLASDEGIELRLRMKSLGIDPESANYLPVAPNGDEASESNPLAGKTIVITGTLSAPRNEIKERITILGGKVTGSVSKNTDFLLSGEGGGSKRDKAESLGVRIISEEELMAFTETQKASAVSQAGAT